MLYGVSKINFLAIFLISLFFQSDDSWKKIYSISVKADFFTTDNAGNIYAIKNDQITKFNPKGEFLKKYSNKSLGKIFSVDASNPLRVLVYYREFSAIVILDSQLTENGDPIQLDRHDLEQCDLACTSFNNGVWLFSRQNMELIRLNETFDKVLNTGNLNRLLNLDLHPNFLIEYNGYIYLNDPELGILVFDIFGTYYKTISIKNLNEFQVLEQEILYYKRPHFYHYQTKELTDEKFTLPDTSISSVREQKSNYYFFYRDSISIYHKR
ncbi:MAG: hypothetical protein ACK452_07725 [Bacteroidota bacterium]|jgi:hypothetical protein